MKPSARSVLVAGAAMLSLAAPVVDAIQPVLGDPAKAAAIVTERCAACHGQDGNSPIPNFPRLAGQYAQHLLKEMKQYKEDVRLNETMKPMVADLSETDMANLALYFQAQQPAPGTVTRPELVERGRLLYHEGNDATSVPACSGCHEEDGSGSTHFPRVAGMSPDYLLEELQRYASGSRPKGGYAMHAVAVRLSADEMEALAQYIAGMK